jgi:hypothetical protein
LALITASCAAIEVDDAGRNPVQEGAVVGDCHNAALEIDQQVFQPFDRVQVEMVGGLVKQQDVWPADQGLGQRDPLFRATGQGRDDGLLVQVQAVQGLFHPLPSPCVYCSIQAITLATPPQAASNTVASGSSTGSCAT